MQQNHSNIKNAKDLLHVCSYGTPQRLKGFGWNLVWNRYIRFLCGIDF